MKTATFKYTHGYEVDNSSLATGVYYNSKNYTLAIQFHDYPYGTPSAFYGGVPESTYRDLINANSLGVAYNTTIKDEFVNLSNGTVYNVDYIALDGAEDSKVLTVAESNESVYLVKGYIRVAGSFTATNRSEAREKFLDSLTEDGYDDEDLAVTEVVIIG